MRFIHGRGKVQALALPLALYRYPTAPGHIGLTDAAPDAKLLQYVCGYRRRLWREKKDVRAVNFVVIDLHSLPHSSSAVSLLEVVHQAPGPEFRHIAPVDEHTVPA